jgi:hypothetical protein
MCALFAAALVALSFVSTTLPAAAQVSVGISVNVGPPPIPYYVQPPCPQQNDIWSPGYWAYDPDDGYYWVPGTWVPAPEPGLLWTPGYWGWNDGVYQWNPGYWAVAVGFYGGVNYGYGYYGNGYAGGRWYGRTFRYNTAVSRVNRRYVHDVYSNRTVVVRQWNRVSYNGGRGGVSARPTQRDRQIARGHRVGATTVQRQHATYAAHDRANFNSVNHGRPRAAAVVRPYSAANRPAAAGRAAHAAPPAHRAAAAPQAHRAAAAPQAHRAAPAPAVHHAAAAPQAHYAVPQVHHAAPQAHDAAPQAHYAAPAQHMAPPQRMAAPPPRAAPGPRAAPAAQHGGPGRDDHRH